ncbi:hypothetical protein SAMN05216350_101560 [Polaromonas sp. YR568]|uniref:hypothetical protein n=1 Tax=Polaromonas sp. YR568 TaxID=1855301 RepID=UPI0008ED2E7B|nr:hypothetical protein [Polaromonas sp. YR568]SFU36789.1 hypothetical protein SAMN05216350_101560 [Polaromonas sp. YR568]
MAPENPSPQPPLLLEGRFSGLSDFTQLIRQAFAAAAAQGWREIVVSDSDFGDWPLGERAVIEALNDWSMTGRKFTMLAKNYDEIIRRHARFVTWRRTWAHIVECRANTSAPAEEMPSALLGPQWVFERLDIQRCTGVAGSEVGRRVALRERLNERLLKSSPAFPATTLGL